MSEQNPEQAVQDALTQFNTYRANGLSITGALTILLTEWKAIGRREGVGNCIDVLRYRRRSYENSYDRTRQSRYKPKIETAIELEGSLQALIDSEDLDE